MPSFSNIIDALSLDLPTHPPTSFDWVESVVVPKKKIFEIEKVARSLKASSICTTQKKTVMRKLTPKERKEKIIKYKNKNRVWSKRARRKVIMEGVLPCISKPIFKYVVST